MSSLRHSAGCTSGPCALARKIAAGRTNIIGSLGNLGTEADAPAPMPRLLLAALAALLASPTALADALSDLARARLAADGVDGRER